MTVFAQIGRLALAVLAGASLAPPAAAEMVLSQVVVDLPADKPPREDIEVWNAGPDRIYVLAEPFEVIGAGTAAEARVAADDPDTSGLLVSPRRMILEPGERRALRIALIADRPPMERVYRVAIKPVAGDVTAPTSALNIFVGYDALILVRPAAPDARLEGERE
jgi:P pilus assembly chaperone PapD